MLNYLNYVFSFLGRFIHPFTFFLLSYYLVFDKLNISQNYIFLFIILCLNWLLIGLFFNLFNYSRGERTEIMFSNLLKAFIVNCLIITTFLFFCLKKQYFFKRISLFNVSFCFHLFICLAICFYSIY